MPCEAYLCSSGHEFRTRPPRRSGSPRCAGSSTTPQTATGRRNPEGHVVRTTSRTPGSVPSWIAPSAISPYDDPPDGQEASRGAPGARELELRKLVTRLGGGRLATAAVRGADARFVPRRDACRRSGGGGWGDSGRRRRRLDRGGGAAAVVNDRGGLHRNRARGRPSGDPDPDRRPAAQGRHGGGSQRADGGIPAPPPAQRWAPVRLRRG